MEAPKLEPAGDAGLQFDRADYGPATAAAQCALCKSAIQSAYFEVNGQVACANCRRQLEALVSGGSGAGRFFRATVYGIAAGAVGAGLYYAVRALTGYELSLISIVVGVLVGGAVRAGSSRRGGWLYQALAMFLTYSAIVSSYVPDLLKAVRQVKAQHEAAAKTASPSSPSPSSSSSSSSSPTAATGSATADPKASPMASWPRPVQFVVAYSLLFVLAFAAPFIGGVQNLLGLVIIGIGLYTAWKANRRMPLVITGPYRVGTTRGDPAPQHG